MAGISDLVKTLMSCSVDVFGNGALRGGKSALMAGARKIGWASGGGDARAGRRFGGHRIARKSLASSGAGRANLNNYDPKNDLAQRLSGPYASALASGSGRGGSRSRKSNAPAHLHGRSSFSVPNSPLGRNPNNHGCGSAPRSKNCTKNPRGFIKF